METAPGVAETEEVEREPTPSLPQPDPRYPLVEEAPELATPPEILNGGFLAEEPWLSDQAAMREAYGLPSDPGTVARLLVEPDAQSEVDVYGFVVSDQERDVLDRIRSHDELALEIKSQAAVLPGWAGSRVVADESRLLQTLEMMVTSDSANELRDLVSRYDEAPFQIRIVDVQHSWRELRSVAASLEGRDDYADELAASDFSDRDRGEILARLAEYDVTSFAYSIDRNVLVAYSSVIEGDERQIVEINDRFTVEVASPPNDVPYGVDPCTQQGCAGPTRAGLSAERTGSSSHCTLGFAIVDGSDEDYSTAGHCSGPGRDTDFSNESGTTLFAYMNFGRNVPLATTGSDWFSAGSTIDAEELNESDHLVSNRLYTTGTNGQRITGIVTQLSVSVGDDVCKSGQTTNYTCGEITEIGDDANPEGVSISDQYRADFWASGGDSGAPVIWQNNIGLAVSILGGGSTGNIYSGPVENLAIEDPGTVIYTTTDKRRDYVLALYAGGLGRHADSSGFSHFRNTVMSSCNTNSARTAAQGILLSSEFRNKYGISSTLQRQVRVEKAYWTLLGRPSDGGGLTFWTDYLTSESRWTALINSFTSSSEFNTRVWSGASAFDRDIC